MPSYSAAVPDTVNFRGSVPKPGTAHFSALTLLAAAGALDDYPAGTLRALTQAERARLAPELADASLAHGDTDGGARILARRQAARIHVCGPGPIAPEITAILTRAGVAEAVCTSATSAGSVVNSDRSV